MAFRKQNNVHQNNEQLVWSWSRNFISLTHHFIAKWQKLKSASQLPKYLWFFTKVGWATDCRLISHVFLWILLLYWTPIKHYRTLFYFLALFLLLNNRQIINQVDNPKNLTSNLNKICHGSSPKPRTLSEKKTVKNYINRKKRASIKIPHPKVLRVLSVS